MGDTIKHEKIKELEELLGLISKDIEIVGKEFSKKYERKVYTSEIIDLSATLAVSPEYRRHIETIAVDARRFLDKVIFTYCEIKNWTEKSTQRDRAIAFQFSNSPKEFLGELELKEFQKSKLYEFILSKQNDKTGKNKNLSIEYLNEIYSISHRNLTKAEMKINLAVDFGGTVMDAGAVMKDCSFLTKNGSITIHKFEPLGNFKYEIDFRADGNLHPNLLFNQETFYKDVNVMSLLRDSHALAKGVFGAMKESL
jgi:hypothetical protein